MPSSIIWGREGRWAVHPGLGTSGPWWPASGNEVGEGWKGGGVITMHWSRFLNFDELGEKEACGQPLHPWNLCMLTRQPVHTFPSWLMSNANMKELRLKHWDLRKDLFSSEPPLTWRSSGSAAHQSAKRMWWKRKRQDHSVKDIEPKQTFKGQTKEACAHSTQKNDMDYLPPGTSTFNTSSRPHSLRHGVVWIFAVRTWLRERVTCPRMNQPGRGGAWAWHPTLLPPHHRDYWWPPGSGFCKRVYVHWRSWSLVHASKTWSSP